MSDQQTADLLELLIDDLEGNEIGFNLTEVGSVYPDDDVIYISGVPCRLSSARPNKPIEPTGEPSQNQPSPQPDGSSAGR